MESIVQRVMYTSGPFRGTILTNMALTFLFKGTLVAFLFVVYAPCTAHRASSAYCINAVSDEQFRTSEPTTFIVEAEANGFMCPFLTPIFMKELERRGAISVIKDDQLRVHVSFPADSNITADD